jgi:hypothetical protein
MTMRKKHVRRIVFACLMVGVLGGAAALIIYGMTTRGTAYDLAIAAELESRLRCKATVAGARATGLSSAAADAVELEWNTGEGRIGFHIEGIQAIKQRSLWVIKASKGSFKIDSSDLQQTLAKWNQRLIQPSLNGTDCFLSCAEFTVALKSDLATMETAGTLLANPPSVNFASPDAGKNSGEKGVTLSVWGHPSLPEGVLVSARIRLFNWPLDSLLPSSLGKVRAKEGKANGDMTYDWNRKEVRESGHDGPLPCGIASKCEDMDMAEWTEWVPGGPLRGKASVEIESTWRDKPSENGLRISISAANGEISRETLKWLEGLPMGLRAMPATPGESGRLAFDRLHVNCHVVAGRATFVASAQGALEIPLVTKRIFGYEVPILTAPTTPFDATPVWTVVGPAMGIEKK